MWQLSPQLRRVIDSHRLLSEAEKKTLVQRAQNGDTGAQESLINHNLRLVVKVALPYQNRGLEPDELVHEGIIGIKRATELFDLEKGYAFSTYATFWIEHFIQRACDNTGLIIRLPVHVAAKSRKVFAVRQQLLTEGLEPTNERIAERADVSIADIEKIWALQERPLRFEGTSSGDDDEPFSLLDIVADPKATNEIESAPERIMLSEATKALSERLRAIVELFYRENYSTSEIAAKLGISDKFVYDLRERALRMLREYIETGEIMSYESEDVAIKKICNDCKKEKWIGEFHVRMRRNKRTHQPYCKECKRAKDRKYTPKRIEKKRSKT